MSLPRLNRSLLSSRRFENVSVPRYDARDLPVKVLQIGEGVFLRAFVDSAIHKLNEEGLFKGSVVVAQPRVGGHAKKLNEQDGLYTVILRGQQNGKLVQEREIVGCVREGIDPYTQHDKWIERARDRDLRFVFSNTTEAGLAITDEDRLDDTPAMSFPAKTTQLLLERYRHFEGDAKTGLIFLPCELIERNGDTLRDLILQTADKWKLDDAFKQWVTSACTFCNSLVDRIVTGYPAADAEQIQQSLGYTDTHLDAAEPYMAWVIEAPAFVREELPLSSLGLNVTWTDDVTPHRERKVRFLNGAHTLMTPVALLAGIATVKQAIDDPVIRAFVKDALHEEILPTLDQPRDELERFAADVLERFANPFIEHKLANIALNSVAKFRARLLPALSERVSATGEPPRRLLIGLAALIALYRSDFAASDDPQAIATVRSDSPLRAFITDDALLNRLATPTSHLANQIARDGVRSVLR